MEWISYFKTNKNKEKEKSTSMTKGMFVEYDGKLMIMVMCDWFEDNRTHAPKRGTYLLGDEEIEIDEVYKLRYYNAYVFSFNYK
jgi:hypothetical protein